MNFFALTIFPDLFSSFMKHGIVRRAIERNLITLSTINIRDYTTDRHQATDDRPYGGGPGRVIQVQPLRDTLHAARAAAGNALVIYLSPQGQRLTQTKVRELAGMAGIILLAGRYEVDGMPVIVTRGTGTWGPRMRLWHPGEILRITLRAKKDIE